MPAMRPMNLKPCLMLLNPYLPAPAFFVTARHNDELNIDNAQGMTIKPVIQVNPV